MTMMEPHQRSTKWWRLLPMNDTVQGTSSCEAKVFMKCMKLTNSLFQVFCQWHCYCWVWKSRYLQKWNSARYDKIQSYNKTFDKVFQSNIAFQCEEIQSCWDIDNKWKFPTKEYKQNDTFSDCPACLPSLSPKSFEPPSSKEKVTTPQSLHTLELQNIFESDCNILGGVWGCADTYILYSYFIFISYTYIMFSAGVWGSADSRMGSNRL